MNPINLSSLVIESTRRCNMECGHCLRGDSEDLNMSKEYIENVVKQCSYISSVSFTGGEPSLYVRAMYDFLDLIEKYGVAFGYFYVATNGKEVEEALLIACCRLYAQAEEKDMCSVQLSNDMFHEYEDVYEGGLLQGLAFFSKKETKSDRKLSGSPTWINEGRYAEDYGDGRRQYIDDIEVEEYDEDLGIAGVELYLNCEGNIILGCDWSYESQREPKNILCKSEDDIGENAKRWSEQEALASA